MFESLGKWSLEKCLDALSSGSWTAEYLAALHKFCASQPDLLRDHLRKVTERDGWPAALDIIRRLRGTKLAAWLPPKLPPTFAVVDIEKLVDSDDLREIAVLLVGEATPEKIASEEAPAGTVLPPQAIARCVSTAHGADFWLGHNIEAFDLPALRRRGHPLPDLPVLDTLLMSLVTEPVRAHHRLDGTHTARGDVQANYKRYQELDVAWLKVAPEEFAWHRSWLSSDRGFAAYFEWLMARAPSLASQQRNAALPSSSSSTHHSTAGAPVPVQSLPLSDLVQDLGRLPPQGTLSLHRPVRGEDLPALADWAQQQGRVLVAPACTLWRLRVLQAEDEVPWEPTRMLGDLEVDGDRLRDFLSSRATGLTASYLLRWYQQGGRCWHQIHRATRDWPGMDEAAAFFTKPASPTLDARIMDHASWLAASSPPPALVVDAERLEWAVADASNPAATLSPLGSDTLNAACEFFSHRDLLWNPQEEGLSELTLTSDDLSSPDLTALLNAIGRETSPSAPAFLNQYRQWSASPETTCVVLNRSSKGDSSLTLRKMVPDSLGWLAQRLQSRNTLYCVGPLGAGPVARRAERFLPPPFVEARKTTLPQLKVLEDGPAGNCLGTGASLRVAAEYILAYWTSQMPRALSYLGPGREARASLARVLRRKHVQVFQEEHFGNRQRTVARLTDLLPASFLGSPHPSALPRFVRSVLLQRLPFPRRSDPTIVAEIRALTNPDDAFEEVILPRMLLALTQTVAELRAQGVDPILMDRRALEHVAYRQHIEAAVGRLEALPQPTSPQLDDTDKAELSKDPSGRGTSSDRSLLGGMDPLPGLRRLLGAGATWRDGQEKIVRKLLSGRDLLVVMPTGSGKSLCFQVPALLRAEADDGLTVVLSPLQALMRDQCNKLQKRGIFGVHRYDSSLNPEEQSRVLQHVRNGWTFLLYMAPEQLLNDRVVNALQERGVAFVVVDEAHCVSEWGHDFRPVYRRIPKFLDQIRDATGIRPQVAAFTATAPHRVRDDICTALGIQTRPINLGVHRTDLFPRIERLEGALDLDQRLDAATPFILQQGGAPGLIYAFTKENVENVAKALATRNLPGFPPDCIDFMHSDVSDREGRERRFIEPGGPTRLMVSTTAFGMGLDKPDIKWILHLYGVGSVEAFAQEIGRAARDPALQGHTLSFASQDNLDSWESMSRSLEAPQVESVLRAVQGMAKPGVAELAVDPEWLAEACHLKEELALASLFALERAGFVRVDGKGRYCYLLRAGKVASPPTAQSFEAWLVQALQASPAWQEIDIGTYAKGTSERTTLTDLDRRLRSLVHDGTVEEARGIRVEPLLDTAPKRRAQLDHAQQCLSGMARAIAERIRHSGGRYLELTPSELADLSKDAQVTLQECNIVLERMHALEILYTKRLKDRIRLAPSRRNDLSTTVTRFAGEALARLTDLERRWATSSDEITLPTTPNMRPKLRVLSGLAEWGILRWTTQSSYGKSYRLTLLPGGNPEQLRASLATQRRLRHQRFEALNRLFERTRDSNEIWAFLQAHFENEEHAPQIDVVRPKLLERLTPAQQQAVTCPSTQPLLINAVAGAGKTHVLARRVLHLQAQDRIDPRRILVLSHSRAGAGAIGSRVRSLAQQTGLRGVRCKTFHAFCFDLYRKLGGTASVVGQVYLPHDLLELSGTYARGRRYNEIMVCLYASLLGSVRPSSSRKVSPADKITDYGKLLDSIRHGHPQLSRVVTHPDELMDGSLPDSLDLADAEGRVPRLDLAHVFHSYREALAKANKIDFAGMIAETLHALRTDASFLDDVRDSLDHILVDEFQDTSRAQEEIFRCLLSDEPCITVVGDNDQTIYTFNGSDVTNILEFDLRNSATWPSANTQVVTMDQNFRSTPRILGVADRFIQRNTRRLPKHIRPGTAVSPERNQHRETNARVRLVNAPRPEHALSRAVETVKQWVKADGIPCEDVAILARINPEHDPERALLDRLRKLLRQERIETRQQKDSLDTRRLIEILSTPPVQPSWTLHHVIGEGQPELTTSLSRDEVTGLVETAHSALDRGVMTVSELHHELQASARAPGFDRDRNAGSGVRLKTIHSAKGEEYRRVIVLYLGDNHFPPNQYAETEEERRVLYVALTRAEEILEVIGHQGNKLYEELLQDGGADLELITWTRPLPGKGPSEPPPSPARLPDTPPAPPPRGPADTITKESILADYEDSDEDEVEDDGYVPITQTNLFKWSSGGNRVE